jgi:DNA (cytosine-5)-methyltransferase 1
MATNDRRWIWSCWRTAVPDSQPNGGELRRAGKRQRALRKTVAARQYAALASSSERWSVTESSSVVGLFAGIGGIELGLAAAGHQAQLLCEIEPGALAVLTDRMPDVPRHADIRTLRSLPRVDIVAGGFPCQDLSQAGRTEGIGGARSGLVDHALRLVRRKRGGPRWLLLENVPFMLQLDRGRAMRHLTEALEEIGYRWAYRVVDARAFGLPQRRLRVVLLASRTEDPRTVLYADEEVAALPAPEDADLHDCGFYWTEGVRGLGWAVNAVPTLKGGSTIGIASPPAVRRRAGHDVGFGVVTPGLSDAERLQGFPAGWTAAAAQRAGLRAGHRWKLVGNAVPVPMAEWVGARLLQPGTYDARADRPLQPGEAWPTAAWGGSGVAFRADVSSWPLALPYQPLEEFLDEAKPLSERATAGFLKRARIGNLRFVKGFLDDVDEHLAVMQRSELPAA